MKCPNCGKENISENKFCQYCGSPLPSTVLCPKCQTENSASSSYCKNCGAPLKENKERIIPENPKPILQEPAAFNVPAKEMPARQIPVESVPKKSHKGLIIALVLVLLAGAGAGIGFLVTNMHSSSDKVTESEPAGENYVSRSAEGSAYIAGEDGFTYTKPFGIVKAGKVAQGDLLPMIELLTSEDGKETWGLTEKGQYIKIQDENGTYLEEIKWSPSTKFNADETFTLLADVDAYNTQNEKQASYKKGDSIQFASFEEDQNGNIRGNIGEGVWVPVIKDNNPIIEVKEKPVKYQADYIMKVREKPSLNAKQVDRVELNEVVTISEVKDGTDGMKAQWGKIEGRGWICIFDDNGTYLHRKN